MAIHYLTLSDELPVFEAALKNPAAPGETPTPFDLTGATVQLRIILSDGTEIFKDASIFGPPANGVVRYQWVPDDFTVPPVLVASPTYPLAWGENDHRLQVRATVGGKPVTFPNYGYDTLHIQA